MRYAKGKVCSMFFWSCHCPFALYRRDNEKRGSGSQGLHDFNDFALPLVHFYWEEPAQRAQSAGWYPEAPVDDINQFGSWLTKSDLTTSPHFIWKLFAQILSVTNLRDLGKN